VFAKFPGNLINLHWAVVKISRVYGTKHLLGIRKKKKKKWKNNRMHCYRPMSPIGA